MIRSGDHYDLIVIGSGPGGAALAHRLSPSGKRILMLERGGYLPRSRAGPHTARLHSDTHRLLQLQIGRPDNDAPFHCRDRLSVLHRPSQASVNKCRLERQSGCLQTSTQLHGRSVPMRDNPGRHLG
jgi:choline dehydrogenase-like flavoprotein